MLWTVALLVVLAGIAALAILVAGLALIALGHVDRRLTAELERKRGPLDVSGAVAGATHYDPGPASPLVFGPPSVVLDGIELDTTDVEVRMTLHDRSAFDGLVFGRHELTLEEELELYRTDGEDVGGA